MIEVSHKPIAVIILNWNGRRLLREFLPSVVKFTPKDIADVIVADNGSSDDSIVILKKYFPSVNILKFSENFGFAEGYNKAIAITNYSYTVLLNSDVEVKNDWLTPLYKFMISHPKAGALQPKVLSYTDPKRFEYAGAAGGFIDRNGYPYCRGRIFSCTEYDKGQYDSDLTIDWASGACLMVNTSVYKKVGGLDARFFAHMEEIDLCWRMRLAGYEIFATGQSAVYHLGGGSLPASDSRKTFLNFRNNLLMMWKNLPKQNRRSKLIIRRLLDTLAWLMFLAKGEIGNAKAVVKAHRDFARMKKLYVADCPNLTRDENRTVPYPPSRPNILIEYYLKGRKSFSAIR